MQHTPPPWTYRPNKFDDWGTVRGGDRADFGALGLICQVRYPYYSPQELDEYRRTKTDPWEANARLVAAAPDLFDAAESALAVLDGYPAVTRKLIAALEKARGIAQPLEPKD